MIKEELIFEFKFTRAYIENKSFFVYRLVKEKYASLFPPLEKTTTPYNRNRTKPFFLIDDDKKLCVYLDFQGHIRQADRSSLYKWFDENKPNEGDTLLFYKSDNQYEFLIELKRKHGYLQPAIRPAESEKKLLQLHPEVKSTEKADLDKINEIIKFFELKEKEIITSDDYQKFKDKLLSEIKITLNNIENLYDLFKKGLISDKDFEEKKKELLSSYGKQD